MPTLAFERGMVKRAVSAAAVVTMAAVCVCAPTPCSGVTLSPGDLVAVDYFSNAVIKLDPVTGAQELISEGNLIAGPLSVIVDPFGNIYVSNIGLGSAQIIRVDPATGAQSFAVVQGHSQITDMALDRAGNVFSTNVFSQLEGGGRIMKVSPIVQHQMPISGGDDSIAVPLGLSVSDSGEVFVAENCSNELPGVQAATRILRINQATGMTTVFAAAFPHDEFRDTVVGDDGYLYVATNGSLIRMSLTTGDQTVIGSIGSPREIAFEPAGTLVMAHESSSVRRFDIGAAQFTTVSSGGLLSYVTDVAVVPQEFGSSKDCYGDTDGNGVINVNDISAAVFQLGSTTAPAAFDTDGSGMVDVHDLTMIIFRLGTVCSAE